MKNTSREFLRAKLKKEFKDLRKEQPQYKNMTFAQYFQYKKMEAKIIAAQTALQQQIEASKTMDDSALDDMIADVTGVDVSTESRVSTDEAVSDTQSETPTS